MRPKTRLLLLSLLFTFPLWVFLNVWQSYRYERLKNEVAELERQQQEWLEKNRKLETGIEALGTPDRLETIAQRDLGLKRPDPERIMRIVLPGGGPSGL